RTPSSMRVGRVLAVLLLFLAPATAQDACANCVELDASSFGLVIAADMAGTVVLMAIIYKCTKKRSSAGPTPSSKAPARSGGRAPPVPSPDYETLNAHTRSQDPYSVVNRTG
uniref:Membrane protein DAP10 n=1 Tax=Scophthalmus maximus TaxID=52904 RepID=A0A8D3D5A9_SCOMX